jgi:phospholipid/cholesterol/gamma-HCH transport system substrate-binding protein
MSVTQAQRARLGFFMIAGCVLIVLFIAIPIGFKLKDQTELYYSIFDKGESISGLVEGAEVKYTGVKIGNIEKIGLDEHDFTRVRVDLRIDKSKIKITRGMEVRTGFMGITGLLYIEITGGHPDSTELKAGSEIASKPSLMYTITGKAEVIISKVEILINHLNALTNPDSLTSVKKILDNVAEITTTTKDFVDELSPNFKQITSSSKRTMQKVETITSNVQSITGKIDQNIDFGQLARIMTQIDSTARAMKNLSQNLDLTIKQSREDITVSMENLREALENINELSKLLMENPSLILKGDPQKQRRTE